MCVFLNDAVWYFAGYAADEECDISNAALLVDGEDGDVG